MPDPINDPIEPPIDPQAQTPSDSNLSFNSELMENAPLIEKKASQRIAGFFRNLSSSFQKNRTPASSGQDAPEEVSTPENSSADQPEIDMELLTFDRLENLGLEFSETSPAPQAIPETETEAFSVLPEKDRSDESLAGPETTDIASPLPEETPEPADPEAETPIEGMNEIATEDSEEPQDEDEDLLSNLRMFFDSSQEEQFSSNPPAYEPEASDIAEEPEGDFETSTLKPSSPSSSFTQDDLQAFLKSLDSKDDTGDALDALPEDSEPHTPEKEAEEEKNLFSQLQGWFSGEEESVHQGTDGPDVNSSFSTSEKKSSKDESSDEIQITDFFPQDFNVDTQIFSLEEEEIPPEPGIPAQSPYELKTNPDNPLPAQENSGEFLPYTSPFLEDDELDPVPAQPRIPRFTAPEDEDTDSTLTNLRAAFTSSGEEESKEKKEVPVSQDSPQIMEYPEDRNVALNLKKILQQEEKVKGPDEDAPLLKPKVKGNQEPEPFILDVIFNKIQKYLSVKSNRQQLAIFSLPILAVILITAAVLFFNNRKPIQAAPAAQQPVQEEAESAITPSSLKLPGGWIFYLQSSHMENGEWKPITAEWMQGATVRRVIALPWTRQSEAVIQSLVEGDEIDLFMSNNDVKGYQVEEVKQVSRKDTSILTSNKPSLAIILYREDNAERWVVICKQ